jgi:hypothetical protein
MNDFLNTAIGSWLKVYITGVLMFVVANGGIRSIDWVTALEATLVSSLPVLINYLNPKDTRYGSKKKIEDFKPEKTDKITE